MLRGSRRKDVRLSEVRLGVVCQGGAEVEVEMNGVDATSF